MQVMDQKYMLRQKNPKNQDHAPLLAVQSTDLLLLLHALLLHAHLTTKDSICLPMDESFLVNGKIFQKGVLLEEVLQEE